MPRQKTTGHTWTFKARFRTSAYGWRGSSLAITRLKEAVSEITKVSKVDPILAADGAVALMERLWPALQDIDTSSGALGSAVHRTLEALIPILVKAPADPKTRGKWLERLFKAVQEDGVQYLTPVEERWGEIAIYQEHINAYADRLLPSLRRIWSEEKGGGFLNGTDICLSSLLEAGRYDELFEVLGLRSYRFWAYDHFAAEALVRMGRTDAAIAYAEAARNSRTGHYEQRGIDAFCERVLIDAGRADEAYRRFGLRTAQATTYLAAYRATVKRYPGIEPRRILLDLIEARGSKGKWFAAAKETEFLDIALDCAAAYDAEPATLIRAARDFTESEPSFAASVSLVALQGLLRGRGYDAREADVLAACDHLLTAAQRLGAMIWMKEQIDVLLAMPISTDRQPFRQAIGDWLKSLSAT
ncbi:MAG: hypothetical protein H7840_14900 [Alphaproteobacteria bacterium]